MKQHNFRAPLWYGALALFVFLFGKVYTHYGHGVTSDHMSYAFLPLLVATSLYLLLAVFPKIPRPQRFSATFTAFSLAAFTLDRITKGIMDIAGAYSNYDGILSVTAITCLVMAIVLYPIEILVQKKQQTKQ